jgi:putative thioredoxin
MNQPIIINVSEDDFDTEVLNFSHNTPVVVDFWAEWCVPCKLVDPILKRLAEHGKGAFRLAKVNVDENAKLAMRYNIHSIPAVKAFRNSEVVAEFFGAQPEDRIREFIRQVVPSPVDLQLNKARNMIRLERWGEATQSFQQVLSDHPHNPTALLGLAKCMLVQGQPEEVSKILSDFPPSYEYAAVERLLPLTKALLRIEEEDFNLDNPIQPTYLHALRLIALGNLPAAMDGILDVLRQDKHHRGGEAHQVILGIFEILGNDNPITREYRDELASILF